MSGFPLVLNAEQIAYRQALKGSKISPVPLQYVETRTTEEWVD